MSVIDGNNNANFLTGTDQADLIHGFGGIDNLNGGFGADTLDGGTGPDRARYDDSDAGVIVSLGSLGFNGLGFGGTVEVDVLTSIEDATGSAFDDLIEGNQDDNFIDGGGGIDTLKGLGGDDNLRGNGIMDGGRGNDRLLGGFGADALSGGADNDDLDGRDGADRLDGGFDADRLVGDGGIDTADYLNRNAGIRIALNGSEISSGGHATGDTFWGIENVDGSDFADQIRAMESGTRCPASRATTC